MGSPNTPGSAAKVSITVAYTVILFVYCKCVDALANAQTKYATCAFVLDNDS